MEHNYESFFVFSSILTAPNCRKNNWHKNFLVDFFLWYFSFKTWYSLIKFDYKQIFSEVGHQVTVFLFLLFYYENTALLKLNYFWHQNTPMFSRLVATNNFTRTNISPPTPAISCLFLFETIVMNLLNCVGDLRHFFCYNIVFCSLLKSHFLEFQLMMSL